MVLTGAKHMDLTHLIPSVVYFVNRRCSQTWKIDKGIIDFHDLTYVYSGSAVYKVNDTEYHLKRGDCIYIPKGNIRQAYTCLEAPMYCYAVNFDLDSLDNGQTLLPFNTTFQVGVYNELIGLYENLDRVWLEKRANYRMKARADFMQILHRLICHVYYDQSLQTTDLRVARVNEYILANYHNRIDTGYLAELSGLNPVYLGALFKKVNNCTIKEYINRIRINNAENLLSTGGYAVNEAALRCGFEDIYYFSKVFKNHKGYSPSDTLKRTRYSRDGDG